ncbi:hypothetical protein D3C72_1764860 [compost metagenome]
MLGYLESARAPALKVAAAAAIRVRPTIERRCMKNLLFEVVQPHLQCERMVRIPGGCAMLFGTARFIPDKCCRNDADITPKDGDLP